MGIRWASSRLLLLLLLLLLSTQHTFQQPIASIVFCQASSSGDDACGPGLSEWREGGWLEGGRNDLEVQLQPSITVHPTQCVNTRSDLAPRILFLGAPW